MALICGCGRLKKYGIFFNKLLYVMKQAGGLWSGLLANTV